MLPEEMIALMRWVGSLTLLLVLIIGSVLVAISSIKKIKEWCIVIVDYEKRREMFFSSIEDTVKDLNEHKRSFRG